MREIVYAGEFNAGSCFLLKGDVNVIVDPGMAWCADRTISVINENIAEGSSIGAILLTHSHYDHVAALPYFRKEWPGASVYAHEHAASVLKKSGAREMMLRLSREAARENGAVIPDDYDQDLLYADRTVREYDEIDAGDMRIKVIETPGHTRDCLSYLVDGEILMSSESMGFYNCDGSYNPQFLVSYDKSLESLEKSKALSPEIVCIPHNGIIDHPDAHFWNFFEEGIKESREFMQQVLIRYSSEEEQLEAMEKKYWHPERFGGWPKEAYDVNALAMLKTISREAPAD